MSLPDQAQARFAGLTCTGELACGTRAFDQAAPPLVFVTTDDGSGWVPARHIDAGSGPAVVLAPYDTTELATAVGELLTVLVIDDPSGWTWVRNALGREGWVPSYTIEPIPAS